jgi:dihydropteroate synthase
MRYHEFKIMGILNVTPDSFSDGGDNLETNDLISSVEEMVENAVDIIDIGGESTRPGSDFVPLEEEIIRVIPVIKMLKKNFPKIPLSIDTTKYEVAKAALDCGVDYINDISGLQFEPRFAELASEYDAGLIIMHIQGNPKLMQINPYYTDIAEDVYSFLLEKVDLAKSYGVKKIWIDVGIGFGKTIEHNLELLRNLDKFNSIGAPQLLGISRKSFLGKILGIEEPKERDLATVLLHSMLLSKGIDIVRVHNVKNLQILRRFMELLT